MCITASIMSTLFSCILFASLRQLLLLVVVLPVADSHAISWSEGHKNCFGVIHSNNGQINKTCHEASYMHYVHQSMKQPKTDYQESIVNAINDLYTDLEEARIPAMINLDPHHLHNSTRRVLLHPISFCLPEEIIRRVTPPKQKAFGRVIPGEKNTYYTLREESQYYEDIQQSLFAITYKKGGWDCLRHAEILAMGSIPLFPNIKNCPHQALTAHPKKLYRLLLNQPGLDFAAVRTDLHHMRIDSMKFDDTQLDRELYSALTAALLQYTRNVLSTRAMAEYVLRTMHTYGKGRVPAVVTKVFYLTHQDHDMDKGDYMTDFLLHGLKQLLGPEAVTDFPRRDGLYKGPSEFNKTDYLSRREKLYGFGFTWGLTIDVVSEATEGTNRNWAQIDERIESHYYDIVILGSGHRDGWASKLHWWDSICKFYHPLEVAWVDGSDNHSHKKLIEKYQPCAGQMFSREGYIMDV